jgi:hypothetical protein
MQINRISSFFQNENSAPAQAAFRLQAFAPCPQALFPGAWAIEVYAIAYAQAQEAMKVRRPNRLQECWN